MGAVIKHLIFFLASLILSSHFIFTDAFADESETQVISQEEAKQKLSKEEIAAQQEAQLANYLFKINELLNLSAAITVYNNEIYLLIEIDHNPNLNEVSLAPSGGVFDTMKTSGVLRESRPFGFGNKPVAYLPLVELHHGPNTMDYSEAFALENSPVSRTQQQINLTQLLASLAEGQGLSGIRGNLYSLSDLDEVAISYADISTGTAPSVENIRIVLADALNLKDNEIKQIHGKEPVTNIGVQAATNANINAQAQVLFRYISHLFLTEEPPSPELIAEALSKLPFVISPERMALLAEKMPTFNQNQMLQVILEEQQRAEAFVAQSLTCQGLL